VKHYFIKSNVNEDAMGGVSAPISTLSNTPGVGNATPASMAAMSGAQQNDSHSIGSGDNWGGNSMYTQKGRLKKKKKIKKVAEENLNPYDKIGVMMAKKMKVPMTFKKKNKKMNTVKQTLVSESLDSFISDRINEEKWIPSDMKKGALSKKLGVPEEKNIPMSVINKKIAVLRKKGEGDKKLSAEDSKTLHQLIAAKNMKKIKK